MRCPKCKTDVPEGHSYCPKCRASVQDPVYESAAPTESPVNRAGKRLFDLLILVILIAGGIVLGRAIQWNKLLTGFKPAAGVSPSPKQSKQARESQSDLPAKRNATRQAPEEKPDSSSKPASAESKGEKTEGSPATEETRPVPGPETIPAASQISTSSAGAEASDARQAAEAGFVAINSYVPAQIYVDGQFSGVTPRTVRLMAGDHQVRLTAEGYEDWTRRIRLKTRQQVGLMASMKKKAGQ